MPLLRKMQDWSTTVVTPLSYDTEPTVIVTFPDAKYMFNAGENTNRSFCQSHMNRKRLRGIFLTQVAAQRASGLGGMIMSSADSGIDKMDIIGPPGLRHYLASMRTYLYRKSIDVSITECLPGVDASHLDVAYQDHNISVYSFPILRLPSSCISMEEGEKSGQKRKRSDMQDGPSKVPKLESGRIVWDPDPDECRENALQQMFKPKDSPRDPIELSKEKEGEQTAVDEYKRKVPSRFYKQLSTFSFPPTFPQASTLAYIVVGPRTRGRIDGKKLNELGVPHSRLRSELTLGKTIQFEVIGPNGPETRTVHPEECMAKSEPPAAVIILDIPSVDMIPSVIRSFDTVYKPFRSLDPNDMEEHAVRVVYHLLGSGVLEDERYLEFMKGFPETTEHIVSSPEHSPNPVTFTSHGFNQYRLSQLDPQTFPLPKFNTSAVTPLTNISSLPNKTSIMTANLTASLRPPGPPQLDSSAPDDRFHSAFTQPQPLPEATAAAFEKAKEAISRRPVVHKETPSGVTVLPLGTGSAMPTKYRNVLSTLIKTPHGNILLDAGEGTMGQLTRRFGRGSEGDVNDILANLKCIFVSHAHADHHMGLAKLLRQRKLLPNPPKHPLYVISIRQVHLHLKEYHDLEDIGLCDDPDKNGVVQIMSDALNFKYNEYPTMGMWRVGGDEPWLDLQLSRKNVNDMCRILHLQMFRTIDVFHRAKAFGAHFKHKSGWSIAFSGDTMPTPNIPRVASGATLLIHEASMGDEEEEKEIARVNAHSTVSQAIQIARDTNAENVLLTHFSARYPKMPPSVVVPPEENMAEQKGPLVTLAFDLAEMDLDDMWKMNLYLPAIEQCFKDSADMDVDEPLSLIGSK
ncbi:hypothetical protein P691DRAFT_717421 [Macrolepiota fuliginosa MF-IS2]|uniref:ribonuclease Z n=1 Tax=Macrolepiota fuliginosa MF-IS2 TaxID=1400762 RepID=A0A9P5XRE6_9AGAR|nr:hypothetical protein P691DRAFT_717421 [Macrolepiota fuliginosa MF-IS2]